MREVSCYSHHLTRTPDFRPPHRLRSLSAEGLGREVEGSVLVLELDVLKDDSSSQQVLGNNPDDRARVWQARGHLNAVDLKVLLYSTYTYVITYVIT